MDFVWALSASLVVSALSLVGALSLFFNEKFLDKILLLLVGFGAGGLIGGAFLHLLPEALEKSGDAAQIFMYVICGFVFFFMLERYFYWRHCHKGRCDIHAFTYLNLVGDGIHNFVDGLIIGTSFFADRHLGIAATLAIIMHEVPQELGDFGVLLYGGFSKSRALIFNFLSALTAVVGTAAGYFFASHAGGFSHFLLPVAAGGFIYIASCDLIPELHKQADMKKSTVAMFFFILGILLMLILKKLCH
ncbi:MAG: ZIP family metal transporter [Candidatus Omnitrophota bacterium]|jgi:zinc and cadmium transporter|nr:ZIP family metal transporter [Candidatus Omnitrophota bacterium]MDD5537862.1 ZIP family metal transporter [Candidatus Omnitrophota bacterium]